MHKTIKHLRNNIENNNTLSREDRQNLLELVKTLEAEAEELDQHPESDQIRQAIEHVGSAGKELEEGDDHKGLMQSLHDSIQAIEASHPRAAEALGRIGNILGRMGI